MDNRLRDALQQIEGLQAEVQRHEAMIERTQNAMFEERRQHETELHQVRVKYQEQLRALSETSDVAATALARISQQAADAMGTIHVQLRGRI